MIQKGLVEKVYDAASIQRWNDHARPFEIVELDKQAHKLLIAYVLARFEETHRNVTLSWIGIIEGGIFEFLHRVILTDIKPTIFHRMMEEKGRELNEYVLKVIKDDIEGIKGGFRERFSAICSSLPSSPISVRLRLMHVRRGRSITFLPDCFMIWQRY